MLIHVDPAFRPDVVTTTPVTVRTNASGSYSLAVAGTAMTGVAGALPAASTGPTTAVSSSAFGTNRFGYGITGAVGSGAGVR